MTVFKLFRENLGVWCAPNMTGHVVLEAAGQGPEEETAYMTPDEARLLADALHEAADVAEERLRAKAMKELAQVDVETAYKANKALKPHANLGDAAVAAMRREDGRCEGCGHIPMYCTCDDPHGWQ